MNKPVKYTLLGLVTVIAVAVAGAVVFAVTFDPNRYKDDIERLVAEQTGRKLELKGPIKLAFWPSLGADVAGVTLSERDPKRQFVSFESAHGSVKLMPLLHGQYIVDSVRLSGLKANIVKGKDGRYNFSDLMEGEAKKPAAEKKPAKEEKSAPVVFDVGSVSIERAAIAYSDLAAGQEYTLDLEKLKTGRIAKDAEGKLELAMVAKRKAPPLQARLSADGNYRFENGTFSANLNAKLDDSNIKTSFTLSDPYVFEASIDKINVDHYLGGEEKTAAKPAAKPAPSAKQEADSAVDFSALKGINAKGKLQVGALEVRGLKLADVSAQLNAANGRVALAPHSAKGYEGTIEGEVVVDANKNHVILKEKLSGISIGPILRDFAQQDRLEGKGELVLDVTSAGNTVSAMKRSLNGTAKVHLRDGAVKGINLGEILRKARSALGGGAPSAAQGESAGASSDKTDFTELSGSFAIKNGIAHNEDLDAKAPLFRLGGAGDINIPASSLDYLAKASIVATAEGQGGRERDRLAGLTVPVRLSGPFDDLKYSVDYRGMAGAAAKSQAGEKVKERLEERREQLEERLGGRLKGLLKR
jgi:AsmA protein